MTHHGQSTYNAFDANPVSIADPSGADGMVYGMAGQSAWSNPFPRGHATFGNGVGMNVARQRGNYDGNTFARNSLVFWGSERALYEQSWEAHDPNRAQTTTDPDEIFSILSYYSRQSKGHTITWWGTDTNGQYEVGYEKHRTRGGSDRIKNAQTNTTMNDLNAFGLGWGVKEGIMDGGIMLNNGLDVSRGLSNYMKVSKTLGVAGSVITTGYSTSQVIDQYNSGGMPKVFDNRDVLDASVGATGLVATGLAYFGIISNPVGWGIGIGVLIYGGVTLYIDTATP